MDGEAERAGLCVGPPTLSRRRAATTTTTTTGLKPRLKPRFDVLFCLLCIIFLSAGSRAPTRYRRHHGSSNKDARVSYIEHACV